MKKAIVLGHNTVASRECCAHCGSEFRPLVGPWPEISGTDQLVCIPCAREALPQNDEWRDLLHLIEHGGVVVRDLSHDTFAVMVAFDHAQSTVRCLHRGPDSIDACVQSTLDEFSQFAASLCRRPDDEDERRRLVREAAHDMRSVEDRLDRLERLLARELHSAEIREVVEDRAPIPF